MYKVSWPCISHGFQCEIYNANGTEGGWGRFFSPLNLCPSLFLSRMRVIQVLKGWILLSSLSFYIVWGVKILSNSLIRSIMTTWPLYEQTNNSTARHNRSMHYGECLNPMCHHKIWISLYHQQLEKQKLDRMLTRTRDRWSRSCKQYYPLPNYNHPHVWRERWGRDSSQAQTCQSAGERCTPVAMSLTAHSVYSANSRPL